MRDTKPRSHKELAESSASAIAFIDALNSIPSQKKIVILDFCHSGAVDAKAPRQSFPLSEEFFAELSQGSGCALLRSCKDYELSYCDTHNSLFTGYLLNGLRGEAISEDDGYITVEDLFQYVAYKVPRNPRGLVQNPTYNASGACHYPIARKIGGGLQINLQIRFRDTTRVVTASYSSTVKLLKADITARMGITHPIKISVLTLSRSLDDDNQKLSEVPLMDGDQVNVAIRLRGGW